MKRALGSIAFAFPVLLLGLVYVGDFYRHPTHTTPVFFGLLIAWACACRFLKPGGDEPTAIAAGGRGLWASGPLAWWIRSAAVVAGFLLVVLLSDRTYQGMRLFPKQTFEVKIAVGVAIAFLAPLVIRPPRASISLGLLVVAGVLVRACGLWQWDINPARRDMLALIVSALDVFSSGENPYGFHQMQVGSAVPLTYPPGLWLGHLPAHALGLDIRWTGVVADGVVALAIGGMGVRLGARTLGPAFAALAAYLFLPDIHWNGIYAEPNLDWAVLGLLCAVVLSRRPLAVGVVMGLALTTRPFNLVLLPFLAIWLLREHGLRVAWRAVLVAGSVAAAVYVPFVMADPDAFYVGTVRWLLEYGQVHNRWFWGMLGVSGLLYKNNLVDWMLPLQLGSVGVLLALAAWRLRTAGGLLVFWALAYALFVAFNPIIWMSFWIGACVIAVAATIAVGTPTGAGPSKGRFSTARGWLPLLVEIAASAAVISCASLLALHLVRHFSEEGREEVRAALIERARPGDLILDRTGWRVSFLKMPFVLKPSELPRGVVLAATPFVQAAPKRRAISPTERRRIWVVERYGLFAGDRRVYLTDGARGEGPYRLVEDSTVGEYRLARLERRAPEDSVPWALSSDIERLSVTAATREGRVESRWSDGSWRFPGKGGWKMVGPREARFDKIPATMIWAHPWPDAALTITASIEGSPSHVTIVGGLADKAPEWRRAPVDVTVSFDGVGVGTKRFPNAAGLFGATFGVPRNAVEMRLEIRTKDAARRHFLLDAYFL